MTITTTYWRCVDYVTESDPDQIWPCEVEVPAEINDQGWDAVRLHITAVLSKHLGEKVTVTHLEYRESEASPWPNNWGD